MEILDFRFTVRCLQISLSDAASIATRGFLRRQLTMSFINGWKQFWIGKCWEIEKSAAIGNSRSVYRLIGNTYPRKPSVNNVIKESDGILTNV